jgi:hypothetical protein
MPPVSGVKGMRARFFVRWTIRKEGERTRNPGSVQTFLPLDAAAEASAESTASQEIFPGKSCRLWGRPRRPDGPAARAYSDAVHCSAVMIDRAALSSTSGETSTRRSTPKPQAGACLVRYRNLLRRTRHRHQPDADQLGIDDSPDPLTKQEKQARIVDVLRARSGVYHPVDFETEYQKRMRPARGSHARGTFQYYNNWDFNVLGAIFEKMTGLKIGQGTEGHISMSPRT